MKKLVTIMIATAFSINAYAGSVIVHPSNADALDDSTISKMFLGKKKSFPSGGKVEPVNMAEGSAETKEFNSKVLNKSASQLKAYWSKLVFTGKGSPPTTVASDAEMIAKVAANPNMIGFIGGSGDGSVKVIKTY
jgi:ABC-type phosphate transport system substrate-binding protein